MLYFIEIFKFNQIIWTRKKICIIFKADQNYFKERLFLLWIQFDSF